jgi:hypothetical protein
LLRKLIVNSELAMGRTPPEGNALQVIEKSWEYAISSVPTHHLEECFRRALAAKRDTFPFAAPEVSRAWEELQQELLRQGYAHDVPALPSGGTGYISLAQFKERHSLPPEWKLGDPYPPESDLYQKPVPRPLHEEELVDCPRCKDAGWTRMPYNASLGLPAKLIRCGCQE